MKLDEHNEKDHRKRPSLLMLVSNVLCLTTPNIITGVIWCLTGASKNAKVESIGIISKKVEFKASTVLWELYDHI